MLTACSSSENPQAGPDEAATQVATGATESTTSAPAPATTAMPSQSSQTTPPATNAIVPTSLFAVAADDDLVLRPEENEGTSEASHWIGRNLMTDTSVELVWSEVEGADVTYRVYRTEITADLDRDSIELTENLLVYSSQGGTTSFIDEAVETGTFYTYLLSVEVDGTLLGRRWANALAITDTQAPSPISNLAAEVIDGDVVLRWDPSTDNIEFASYSVSLVIDGELRYLGGGADPAQSSFVDTRPEPGTNIYSIQAVDFHNNRTEEARVTLTVP